MTIGCTEAQRYAMVIFIRHPFSRNLPFPPFSRATEHKKGRLKEGPGGGDGWPRCDVKSSQLGVRLPGSEPDSATTRAAFLCDFGFVTRPLWLSISLSDKQSEQTESSHQLFWSILFLFCLVKLPKRVMTPILGNNMKRNSYSELRWPLVF